MRALMTSLVLVVPMMVWGCESDNNPLEPFGTGGTGGTGGSTGSGGTGMGGDNPCLQAGNPACSTAELDEFGQATVEVFFTEQRVEATSGSGQFFSTAKGGGDRATFGVSAFEGTASCSTNQPGDTFSNVECVSYSIESYMEAPVEEWFRFQFSAAAGGPAPVTLRVVKSGDVYTLEVTWGSYDCDTSGGGNGQQVCFGETVGDGSRDSCCRQNSDCESDRCCTNDEICDFSELDNRYTCRSPR